jgi:hypothetical protein
MRGTTSATTCTTTTTPRKPVRQACRAGGGHSTADRSSGGSADLWSASTCGKRSSHALEQRSEARDVSGAILIEARYAWRARDVPRRTPWAADASHAEDTDPLSLARQSPCRRYARGQALAAPRAGSESVSRSRRIPEPRPASRERGADQRVGAPAAAGAERRRRRRDLLIRTTGTRHYPAASRNARTSGSARRASVQTGCATGRGSTCVVGGRSGPNSSVTRLSEVI